ncbi:hypothetical protein [Streptomyces fagopyri]|uniref:hypothetical protein n=1 Tax=Streptomyces fagopyri TaxID=2662397 RepID=UPI0033D2CF69
MAENKSDRAGKKDVQNMTPEERRETEAREGRTAQKADTAPRFSSEEAREAGHEGGSAGQAKRQH